MKMKLEKLIMEINEEIFESHTHFCPKCQNTYNCPRPALKLSCIAPGNKKICCNCSKHPDALKAWFENKEYRCHKCGKALSWKTGEDKIDPKHYEDYLYSPGGSFVCDLNCGNEVPRLVVETKGDFQRLLSQKAEQSFLDINTHITSLYFEDVFNCENSIATTCICGCKEEVVFTYADFRKHINLNQTNFTSGDALLSIFLCASYLDINHKLQYIDYYCSKCKLPIRIYYDFEEFAGTQSQLYKYQIELLTIGKQLFVRQHTSLRM
jgi:hypothetical protein